MASGDRPRAALDAWHIGFGAAVLAFALLALLVWFPQDIKGGIIVTNQLGKPEPGDAFFPVILAGLMALLGAGQLLSALFAPGRGPPSGRVTAANLAFLAELCAIIAVGLALIYWLGPLVVDALGSAGLSDRTYRQLSDTPPYKYIGYVAGGFTMTVALIARAEGRFRARALLTVALVITFLIVALDVLLYNIQLPPNADY